MEIQKQILIFQLSKGNGVKLGPTENLLCKKKSNIKCRLQVTAYSSLKRGLKISKTVGEGVMSLECWIPNGRMAQQSDNLERLLVSKGATWEVTVTLFSSIHIIGLLPR